MGNPEPESSRSNDKTPSIGYAPVRRPWWRVFQWNLSRTHGWIFLFLLIVFSALTAFIVNAGADDGPGHRRTVIVTTLSTSTGPFTGAICRDWQGCCTDASLHLLRYAGGLLVMCLALQFVRFPLRRGQKTLRLLLWALGWLGWFGSGILSFAHALA